MVFAYADMINAAASRWPHVDLYKQRLGSTHSNAKLTIWLDCAVALLRGCDMYFVSA